MGRDDAGIRLYGADRVLSLQGAALVTRAHPAARQTLGSARATAQQVCRAVADQRAEHEGDSPRARGQNAQERDRDDAHDARPVVMVEQRHSLLSAAADPS